MTGTVSSQVPSPGDANNQTSVQTNMVVSDANEKIFCLMNRFGIGSYGDAHVNNLLIAHHLETFRSQLTKSPTVSTTNDLASRLLKYFQQFQSVQTLGFIVVGYDGSDPWVVSIDVKRSEIKRVNMNAQSRQVEYGVHAGGDTFIVGRLLSQPAFNPPFPLLNLQDAIDFSRHLIRTTIDQMRFEPRFATVGGPIDTLVASGEGAHFLAHKSLTAS
jgi:20S proteasome alpha/beta subunit